MQFKETDLYELIAQYLNLKHPGLLYRFDLGGLWTPSHLQRNLYGRLNRRAYPDLFIAKASVYFNESGKEFVKHGLFIELKRDGVRLKKRNGEWATPHLAEQAAVLDELAEQGYIAQFAVGYESAIELIESYLWSGHLYTLQTREEGLV